MAVSPCCPASACFPSWSCLGAVRRAGIADCEPIAPLRSCSNPSCIEQEFKNARELQQVLVPENIPPLPGFAITSAYRPAAQVGGDFFQIIPLQSATHADGSTLLILGDVSGKGLRAAPFFARPCERARLQSCRNCNKNKQGFSPWGNSIISRRILRLRHTLRLS